MTETQSPAQVCEANASPTTITAHSWNSATDLEEHGRVPWPEFALQVQNLCAKQWPLSNQGSVNPPQKKPFVERMFGNSYKRLADILKVNKSSPEIQNLVSETTPDRFIIEPMRGGTFNRVVGITVLSPKTNVAPQHFVLRVPRYDDCKPERDIDILKFVKQYDIAPVPTVIAADISRSNPLNHPYIILERIPEYDLQSKKRSWPDLTHEQKKTFVKAFAKLQLKMQGLRNPYAGQVERSKNTEDVFTIGPLHVGQESDKLIAKRAERSPFFQKIPYVSESTTMKDDEATDQSASNDTKDSMSENSSQHTKHTDKPDQPQESPAEDDPTSAEDMHSPYHFIITQLGRWKHQTLELNPFSIKSHESSVLEKLVLAATQMESQSWLDSDITCLCHCDLDPRNIMVDIDPTSSTLKLTAILDWDLAIFAPRWVGCKPPTWIWNWVDGENEDEETAAEEPEGEEQRELKRLWEREVGVENVWYAYDPHWRLARCLFMVARFGLECPGHCMSGNTFLREWGFLWEDGEEDEEEDGEEAEGGEGKGDGGSSEADGKDEQDGDKERSEKEKLLMASIADATKVIRDAYKRMGQEYEENEEKEQDTLM